MDDGERRKGFKGYKCQSIYCTLSQITWVSHIKIHSVTSIGTALLYTKSITRGQISSHHKTKNQKTIHKNQYFFLKNIKKKESIHIKVLYNVDKTAQNCYKKVEELVKPHHIVEDLHLTVFQFTEVEVEAQSYPAWSTSFPPATTLG